MQFPEKSFYFSLTFILYPTIFFSQSVYIFMCLVYFFFQTPSKFTFSILLSNKNFTLIQIYPYMYDYIGKGRYIDTLFKVTFSSFFFLKEAQQLEVKNFLIIFVKLKKLDFWKNL